MIVPSDPLRQVRGEYFSADNVWRVEYPNHVIVVGADTDRAVKNFTVETVDPNRSRPAAVGKVSRNHPCPCGSGDKYKRCHGRPLPRPLRT
jgi:hypothetical protein